METTGGMAGYPARSPGRRRMPDDLLFSAAVNGARARRLIPASRSLLDLLRDDLQLTGTRHGCDVGDCGACTVLVDGSPRLSCITLAAEVEGAEIRTIEGLPWGPIHAAFDRHVAAQCGYCTPGIVLCLHALLAEQPAATEADLRESLGSNICRCTGYTKILDAARDARDARARETA